MAPVCAVACRCCHLKANFCCPFSSVFKRAEQERCQGPVLWQYSGYSTHVWRQKEVHQLYVLRFSQGFLLLFLPKKQSVVKQRSLVFSPETLDFDIQGSYSKVWCTQKRNYKGASNIHMTIRDLPWGKVWKGRGCLRVSVLQGQS